jgi:hypothetical protein
VKVITSIDEADDIVNLTIRNTIELDGSDKPAAVADMITRVIF